MTFTAADFTIVMISCAARDASRAETIKRLNQTDWPEPGVIVSMDKRTDPSPQRRQLMNALDALRIGFYTNRRFILFLEDDLEFNRYLFHNLTHWPVLDQVTMASLYNPTIFELERNEKEHWFIAKPECIYGSQAYLFSRDCVSYLISHWHEVEGMQDIKASRLAARLMKPIYYYTPSLVQHVGKESTFGGGFHTTNDFDRDFRAETECRGRQDCLPHSVKQTILSAPCGPPPYIP